MFCSLRHFNFSFKATRFFKEMSSLSFIQFLNPITKKMEWKIAPEDFDYAQQIATSCYSDMLHDDERNKKFGAALEKAIKKLHRMGRKAHVLDIGTGTGLLSMLAVKYGADSVVACEAFLPMAYCAEKILEENNMSDKIKIVNCHSKFLTVGENGDLKQKANILVSEVFDTELIGEGAISTFNYAFENLLEVDSVVIPSLGIVYAQIVESPVALKWNRLEDWMWDTDHVIKIPKKIKECYGTGAVHDIQLSQFKPEYFKVLSPATPVFKFEWGKKKIQSVENSDTICRAVTTGKAQVVFMWWELIMDEDGEIVINCAPFWEHPSVKGKVFEEDFKTLARVLPWRDHWMQGVYFLPKETFLEKNVPFRLMSSHDEYSFWFETEMTNRPFKPQRPVCDCSFHMLTSRTRIGAMNDDRRRKKYLESLKTVIKSETVCVVLSDGSLLGFLCASLGARKVYFVCESPFLRDVYTTISEENKLTDVVNVCFSLSEEIFQVLKESEDVLVVFEPYFRELLLPWDNVAIWHIKEEIVKAVQKERGSIRVFPKRCTLQCCLVQFDHLWKTETPLNTCEGLSMKTFDDLITSAKDKAESQYHPQPLWEYPAIALTSPSVVFEFDLNKNFPNTLNTQNREIGFECRGICNGVVFWMDYWLTDHNCLSLGPVDEVIPGEYVNWDMFERQGARIFRNTFEVNAGESIFYEAEFHPEEADFNFKFYTRI